MNIHSYEKLWLIAAMLLIVAFIATITYGSVGLGIAMIDDSEETVDPNALHEHERFSDPGVQQVGDNEYEVNVIAEQFNFNPGTEAVYERIVVPQDSTVTFYVTSPDVIHSFSLVGTNVNTMVVPGEVSTMTVEFDETREYGILCNEYCGAGHHGMEGVLEVVPEDEFHLLSIDDVDASDELEQDETGEFTVTVANDALDAEETVVALEIGEDVREESTLDIDAESTANATFTVDGDTLEGETGDEDGSVDWTVTVEDETESGSLTVDVGEQEDA